MSTTLPRNLESLSYTELESYEQKIQALKKKRFQEADAKTAKARQMLETMARDLGVAPAVPTNGTKQGPKKIVIAKPAVQKAARKFRPGQVRYRDPANPKNIWTGRGPQPKWLAAYTQTGRALADFAVA